MTASQSYNKNKQENIFVENDEEIPSIISRIKNNQSSEIALVVPRGSAILQSLVNLKLLKKQVHSLGKKMCLVTTDNIGRNLAAQSGLKVYESIHSKKPILEPKRKLPEENQVIKIDKSTPESPHIPIHHFQDPNDRKSVAKPIQENQPVQGKDTQNKSSQPLTVEDNQPNKTQPELSEISSHRSLEKSQIRRLGRFSSLRISLKPRLKIGRAKLLIGGLAVLVGLFFIYFFIPRAIITFVVEGENFEDSFRVEVSINTKTVSLEERKIPGHLIEIEKEDQETFQSSGAKNVGEKSQGRVTFYNSWSTDAQTIPANTVLSREGKRFVTTADISIPGATLSLAEGSIVTNPGTAEGLVQASEAGEEYNLSAGTFDIISFPSDKREKFYAQSAQDFSGGSTREVQVVSAEDLEKAVQSVRNRLSGEIFKELEEQNKDKTILKDAVEYISVSQQTTAQENEESKDFKLALRLRAKAIAFERETFQKSFVELIKLELPEGKDLHLADSDQINTSVKEKNLEEGRLIVEGSIKTQIAPSLDQDKLKKIAYGKKVSEASNLLENQTNIEQVKIQLSPEWLPRRIPYFNFAVKSKIEYK